MAAANVAYRAAEAAADIATRAMTAAVSVAALNDEEKRFLAARIQLAQFALESKEATFAPARQEAGGDTRLEAQKLKKVIAELVSMLAGDLTEEEEEDGGGGVGNAGRILVHDHNTNSIRFSLIKRLKLVEVVPAPPSFLLPCLDELLLTSLFRLSCTHWVGPALGDATLTTAVHSIFDMREDRLTKDYYGTKINLSDAQLAYANLLPKDSFKARELRRIDRELRAQQQSFQSVAAIERPRLESLLAVLPLVKAMFDDGVADKTTVVQRAVDPLGKSILETIAAGGNSWHHEFARPPRLAVALTLALSCPFAHFPAHTHTLVQTSHFWKWWRVPPLVCEQDSPTERFSAEPRSADGSVFELVEIRPIQRPRRREQQAHRYARKCVQWRYSGECEWANFSGSCGTPDLVRSIEPVVSQRNSSGGLVPVCTFNEIREQFEIEQTRIPWHS